MQSVPGYNHTAVVVTCLRGYRATYVRISTCKRDPALATDDLVT